MTWSEGRRTVDYLLEQDRLERLIVGDAAESAAILLDRAELRLKTAEAGAQAGDAEGAFVAAYDSYRMAADSLLVCQALRATNRQGGHAAVEDAVSAQFAVDIEAFAKPTFERFRRSRNAAQYFDPAAPPIVDEDARWAIETAQAAVDGTRELMRVNPPPLFDS